MSAGAGSSELSLGDYVDVVRRWKRVIAAAVVLGVTMGLVLSLLQDRQYRATARLILQPLEGEELFDVPGVMRPDPARALKGELEVVRDLPVPAEIAARSADLGGVSATASEDSDIIRVSATSPDPEFAAQAADAYARAYIESRRNRTVESLKAAAAQLESKVKELDDQIAAIDETGPPEATSARRQALLERQSAFRVKLDEVQVEASIASGGARLAGPTRVPSTPFSPQPLRNTVVAGVLGLGLALGVVLVLEQLDDRIKSKDQLDPLTPDIPVLGIIPVAADGDGEQAQPVILTHPDSPAAEAIRSLRTSVEFLMSTRDCRVLQVTSANVSEGKTTIAANLAIALCQAGHHVLLLCCDLRRPLLPELFGLNNDAVGFTSVARGEVQVLAAFQRVAGLPQLRVLTAGPPSTRPSELLDSRRAQEIFNSARATADVVLIDSPPVLPVTDAAILARRVDATLVVVASGQTRLRHLRRALEILAQVNARILGIALNRAGDGDRYEPYHGYRPEERRPPLRRRA